MSKSKYHKSKDELRVKGPLRGWRSTSPRKVDKGMSRRDAIRQGIIDRKGNEK